MKKTVFIILFLSPIILFSGKPKIYDFSKDLYFNPKRSWIEIEQKVNQAGYRLQSSDTSYHEYDSTKYTTIKNKYKLYRKILGLETGNIYIRSVNDTILVITIYFKIEKVKQIEVFTKFVKKLNSYVVEGDITYDGTIIGDKYQYRIDLTLRDSQLFIYTPIVNDIPVYYKMDLEPNNNMGAILEEAYKNLEDAFKNK